MSGCADIQRGEHVDWELESMAALFVNAAFWEMESDAVVSFNLTVSRLQGTMCVHIHAFI